jgi:16S rRNA C1402 N4-methylase RsmH
MPLSDAAAREIANVLRKYLETKAVEQIVNELLEIRGDKDFRDTIERLVDALRMTDPTSKHFRLMVYDDVVTGDSVTSPEMTPA